MPNNLTPLKLRRARKILIFSLAYLPLEGGAEIAVKEITNRLDDARLPTTEAVGDGGQVDFDLVTLRFNKNHAPSERVGNVNVYRIGGSWGCLSKILFIPQAALFALRRRYDAYWAIMTYMLFPVVLLRLFGNKTPYLLTLQDGDPFEHVFTRLRIFPFLPLLFYGFRHAHKVQAISNFLAEWAMKMGYKDRVEVIPNGVDVERFRIKDLGFKNKDKIILVTTSRLVRKNGVKDIIESLKYLPGNVELRVIGAGSLESGLKRYSRILNLESRIKFLGYVPYEDIPRHLHEADIFVRPSLSEGFGSSFIEAMAAGLPVIATPVGGIVDFLEHEKTGLFCEVQNPQSIAEQIKRLIADEPLRKKIVENAEKMVREKYDWTLVVKQMEAIFDRLR